MLRLLIILLAVATYSNAAFSQTPDASQQTLYIPFPANFEALPEADQKAALAAVDANSEKYFRSKEYGYLLTQFMHLNNPGDIKSCDKKLQMLPEQNRIEVVEPLLFEKADDLHPLVGKWEQQVAFNGCDRLYKFVIDITANKAAEPLLALRPERN